jgi:hypothetical protein
LQKRKKETGRKRYKLKQYGGGYEKVEGVFRANKEIRGFNNRRFN